MAGYKAGNLELSLTAINGDAIRSIDAVENSLRSLSSVLKSVTTTDMKWINSFGTKMKNLSKKLTDIDWSSVDSGFNRLTVAITPFIDKVNSAQASLTALYGVLQKVSGKKFGTIMNVANGGGKSSKGGGLLNFGKVAAVFYMFRRIGQSVANIVQYGTDFTETLNLWQVAMRNNLDQADEFIQKMNKAYSISQKTLMNAQAIFKNMIGSLGQISDTVAYQLSESILQMALDYSSLYNVTFENSITKFQAALAGQVRPIRSVSGYDITETTLYQVYQQLGGTKTMRQLNRTEKQLLSIYAIFQQMQRSGAVGDLEKTLSNYANQSRMMNENFKELKTYVGLFLQDLLQSWGVLKYINAGLIFLTEIVKALTNYKAPNFIEGMFESTTAENKALDELQGKLLDFDKIRALDSSAGVSSQLAIDQTILKAVSDYQSILESVKNEARELATKWLKDIGIWTVDENGELKVNKTRLDDIKSTIDGIVIAVGVLMAFNLGATIVNLTKKLTGLTSATAYLNIVLVGGIIFSFVKMIKSFEDGNTAAGMLAMVGLAACITAFGLLNAKMLATMKINISAFLSKVSQSLQFLTKSVSGLNIAFSATLGVLTFIVVDGLLNSLGEDARRVVAPIFAVVGAVAALTAAFLAMNSVITWGTALPILLASVGAAVAGVKAMLAPEMFAIGASDIDGGTLFVAGEAGKTEAVYTGANGKTNVANIQQMREANYQGTMSALQDWWKYAKQDIPQFREVSQSGLFTAVDNAAKLQGKGFAKR